MMIQQCCAVTGVEQVADNIFHLSFASDSIGRDVKPGQFLNIKVEDGTLPLLRRPFSVYRSEGATVSIVFNVVGRGTSLLSRKRPGDLIDVLGPLGVPFNVDSPDFDQGVLVGGGLGVAPLPITTEALRRAGKSVLTFLGARTKGQLVESHLEELRVATDDGSKGFQGTVVELLQSSVSRTPLKRAKIFGCGPTPMLRALAAFATRAGIPCEVSLEGPMGCGIGICQGCPVELVGGEKSYALMCKDGPVFDVRRVKL